MIICGDSNYVKLYEISGTTFTYRTSSGDKGDSVLCCRFARFKNKIAYGDKEGDTYT